MNMTVWPSRAQRFGAIEHFAGNSIFSSSNNFALPKRDFVAFDLSDARPGR